MPILSEKPLIEILSPEKQHDRFDINYYLPEFIYAERYIENCDIELTTLSDVMTDDASYGVLPPSSSYMEEGGIPLVRSSNVSNSGIDYENAVKVPPEWINSERARIKSNDVLISIKGARAFFDMCVASVNPPDAIVNGSIFRFQCKENYDPKFVVLWLLSKPIQTLVYRERANLGISYISSNTLSNIPFPRIDINIQNIITKNSSKILGLLNKKYQVAEKAYLDLLRNLSHSLSEIFLQKKSESFLFKFDPLLRFTTPNRIVSIAKSDMLQDRLDPRFYKPLTLRAVSHKESYKFCKLGELADIARSTSIADGQFPHVAIDEMPNDPWEPFDFSDPYNGNVTFIQQGDIAISRLLPTISNGKCFQAWEDMTGSPEFIRIRSNDFDSRILLFWLKSSVVREYLEGQVRGSSASQKRFTEDDLIDCPVPTSLANNLSVLNACESKLRVYMQKRGSGKALLKKVNEIRDQVRNDVLILANAENVSRFERQIEEALQ